MFRIERCFQSDRLMKALTGLSRNEFQNLLPDFQLVLDQQKKAKKDRQRKPGGGRSHTLRTPEEKLFFILFYVKCYPTFDLLAFLFRVDRAQPCRWVGQYLGLLEQALGRKVVLPVRQIHQGEEFLTLFPGVEEVWIDGTERPIQRPKNQKKQKSNYSGKKKRHTKKNIVLTDCFKQVLLLGATHEGKKHDKEAADDENLFELIPKGVSCWLEKGFQGVSLEHPHLNINQPKKKPKGKELTEAEKRRNRQINSIRIKVEHALSGVKRLGGIKDPFRNKKEEMADQLMVIACGLWNFHFCHFWKEWQK
jgi:hypothetical protein